MNIFTIKFDDQLFAIETFKESHFYGIQYRAYWLKENRNAIKVFVRKVDQEDQYIFESFDKAVQAAKDFNEKWRW